MSFRNKLKQVDIDINEDIDGNPDMTISRQAARGVQKRYNNSISKDSAMRKAHGNMGVAATSIVTGAVVMKKNPWLGAFLIGIGAVATAVTVDDWREGDCDESEVCE